MSKLLDRFFEKDGCVLKQFHQILPELQNNTNLILVQFEDGIIAYPDYSHMMEHLIIGSRNVEIMEWDDYWTFVEKGSLGHIAYIAHQGAADQFIEEHKNN